MAQLLIRPDRQDTKVVGDLLAPGGGPRLLAGRPAIAALVIDATTAVERPAFAEAAAAGGVPALIDPLTFGLQTEPSMSSPFRTLPYAPEASSRPADVELDRVVAQVLDHQLANGATGLVQPYFHVRELGDGWDELALRALAEGARRRESMDLRLGSVAVLSGNRAAFSTPAGAAYIDRFTAVAADAGAEILAVCLSPSGKPTDSYNSVARLADVLERASSGPLPVVCWRQGVYGLTMTALGASGYECGIGQGEATDIAAAQGRIRNHQPLATDEGFQRPSRFVFLQSLGRSVPRAAAEILLTDPRVQGEFVCDVPGCCPTVADTLGRQRHHAVRARAHQLAEVSEQPPRWRLQHALRSLRAAVGSARRANEVLESAGHSYRVPIATLIAQVEYLDYRGGQAGGGQLSA